MQILSLAKKQGSSHEDNIMTKQPCYVIIKNSFRE